MKYLALLIIGMLLLVSCTTQTVEETTESEDTKTEVAKAEEMDKEPEPAAKDVDADIIIVNGKLDPEDLTIPVDQTTTLTVHNTMSETMRFDIALYKSEVSEDIEPNGYTVVTLNPIAKGFVSMDINGASLGTIKIE